jgi:hypothetical protein
MVLMHVSILERQALEKTTIQNRTDEISGTVTVSADVIAALTFTGIFSICFASTV